MPWKVADVDRFKQGLNLTQKKAWVKIANRVLDDCRAKGNREGQCDRVAIQTASSAVMKITEQRMKQLVTVGMRFGKSEQLSEILALDALTEELIRDTPWQ